MAAKKSKAQKEGAAQAKLEKEQAEALGAGREETHDRVDKPAVKEEKKEPPRENDTPSALALKQVGDLNGEDLDDPQEGLEHGEKYQAAKKKARWG
jgi:hypothetical protein